LGGLDCPLLLSGEVSRVVRGSLDLAFRLRGTPDPESETLASHSAAFSGMIPSMEQEIDGKLQSNSR
jgi:hypothetical protein